MPPAARRHLLAAAKTARTGSVIFFWLFLSCLSGSATLASKSSPPLPAGFSPFGSALPLGFVSPANPTDNADQSQAQQAPQDLPAGAPAALTFDLRAVPSAPEYRTDAPDGPAFLGSDAASLDRSLARVNKSLGASLRADNRLALLARWVYEHLGPDRALPPQSVFDVLTRRLGLPEPLPHLLVITAQNVPRLAEAVSARLAKVFDLASYTHIGGLAQAEPARTTVVVVLALSRRHVRLAPIPRSLPGPGRIRLEGRLDPAFAMPELAHTLPSGETRITELGAGADFRTTVRLAETGRHRLEIIAQGREGPDVVANIPVFVGVPVEDSVEALTTPADSSLTTPEAARARLFELVNAERVRFGLAPLAPDPALDAVALRHSEDMRANDFVAHVSPTTGGTEDRLSQAGIATNLAAENVGRGYAPDEIHRGFMESPGHRAAILLADVTHLGIGVVAQKEYGRTSLLVTEIFIRRVPPLPPDAREAFLTELNRHRASSGSPPLRESPRLSVLADETAREFLAQPTFTQDEVLARLADRLRPSRGRRGDRSYYSLVCVVGSLEEGVKQAVSDPKTGRFNRLGLGLAQGSRPGMVPNSIIVVLVFSSD